MNQPTCYVAPVHSLSATDTARRYNLETAKTIDVVDQEGYTVDQFQTYEEATIIPPSRVRQALALNNLTVVANHDDSKMYDV